MESKSVTPVVAGVSGSPASHRAVEAAARQAAARGVPLRLVHMLDERAGLVDQPRIAGDLLRQARALAVATAPGLWSTIELFEGDPVTGLVRMSRQAALTVLGDGGLADLAVLPADAIAVRVAARAFGSVLVTRAEAAPDGPVLAVVDPNTISGDLLAVALDAAARRGAALRVAHVGEVPHRGLVVEDVLRSRASGFGVPARFEVLTGDPTPALRPAAGQASLVVAGAALPRPVTRTLLHGGRGPIVVFRGVRRQSPRTAIRLPLGAGR